METLILPVSIVVLVLISALCAGLNVALVSLDVSNLKRKAKLGDKRAARILPLRKNLHLSLASILLTNVAAASAIPLVLNSELGGIAAGALSTLMLVIFAEIIPQALFARHALALYARFHVAVRLMIVITYPLSKPLQLILDAIVGQHGIPLHTRHELGLLISEHLGNSSSELDEDEVEIVRGALQLSEKRVREIMTPVKHVYWLTPDTIIDHEKTTELHKNAWSRIPVFSEDLTQCYGIILMKDLVDREFPVSVHDLPLYQTRTAGSMTALDTMFRKFIGARTHLMPVEKDDVIVGIVTIEDLLEEILGHEIIDETDGRNSRR